MKAVLPRRSLFWTFAGVFLLVLAGATLVQVLISAAVLRPLAAQNAREHAMLALERAAGALAAPTDTDPVADRDPGGIRRVIRVLRENHPGERGTFLVFCAREGPVVPDRRLGGELHRRIVETLARAGLVDSTAALAAPPGFDRPPRGDRPPPGDGDQGPPDGPEPPPGREGMGPPGPDRPGAPNPGGALPDPRVLKLELLGHREVLRAGQRLGEIAAVGVVAPLNLMALPESRGLLLFLPVAVLASGAAGLVMVRILVRRIEKLGRAAERVTGGDLAVHVDGSGRDEIGLLEEQFNRMTERLAAAREQVAGADRQRRRLLADVSHELATPLTSIRGYVETLLNAAVPTSAEERAGFLADVLDETRRLELLISDLFDLARLESGAGALAPVRLDWVALCGNAARRFAPRFAEAGLEFRFESAVPQAWLRADGRRLEQVVENLLVNALRYVPAGGTVSLVLAELETPAGRRFRLTVSDDGPGLAEADLPHVFERFYRAAATRSAEGTGLGLAIVREIVLQHGGEVRAGRNVPRGAAFAVDLPAAE